MVGFDLIYFSPTLAVGYLLSSRVARLGSDRLLAVRAARLCIAKLKLFCIAYVPLLLSPVNLAFGYSSTSMWSGDILVCAWTQPYLRTFSTIKFTTCLESRGHLCYVLRISVSGSLATAHLSAAIAKLKAARKGPRHWGPSYPEAYRLYNCRPSKVSAFH